MKPEKPLGDDEAELFREAVGDVRPLAHDRVEPHLDPPPPRARSRRLDEAEVLHESLHGDFPDALQPGEELFYARPGVQHNVIRKLRRGQYALQAELDLHGLTVDEARREVARFVADCLDRNLRCVRVIHGKGMRSREAAPPIKSRIGGWLARRDDVLAFAPARRADGGSGALYLLLRKRRPGQQSPDQVQR